MLSRTISAFRLSWRGILSAVIVGAGASAFHAEAEALPPRPDTYFTDEAHLVDAATAEAINLQLDQFERDTSNQLVVAIYPGLPDQADPDQYSIDTFNSWGVGQKGKDNGAVLFVYVREHKIFICTGRGLEGALPDATCRNIISQVITPAFKQGKFTDGVQAGVNALLAACKGEYKGSGETDNDAPTVGGFVILAILLILIVVVFIFVFFMVKAMTSAVRGLGSNLTPTNGPRPGWSTGNSTVFSSGSFGNDNDSFGGGGSSRGGFTAGGGNSAGGGAGGSW